MAKQPGNYPKLLKAEMGKESSGAAADDGDDAVEVGVDHGRAGWEAEATVEQILGHFFLSPDTHICSLAFMPLPLKEHIRFDQSRYLAFFRPRF